MGFAADKNTCYLLDMYIFQQTNFRFLVAERQEGLIRLIILFLFFGTGDSIIGRQGGAALETGSEKLNLS